MTAVNGQPLEVAYRIDESANLVWVGDTWTAFAHENGASQLAERSILGESLWHFIEGIETRHLYQLIFDKVRCDRSAIVLPFRCDSPDLRRFMELRISPHPESRGELQLTAFLLNSEPRDAVPLLDRDIARCRGMLAICSFCKRIEVDAVGWLEVEAAASQLELLSESAMPRLSHGVCPDCKGRARVLLTPRR